MRKIRHGQKVYDGFSLCFTLQNLRRRKQRVKRMMADIESGKVATVIVKDQSRLGRDYLQTGMLMEITFPQYDVRFIAINDGVDSANGISDFSGIKNYFNDFYARDTSKKIRAWRACRHSHPIWIYEGFRRFQTSCSRQTCRGDHQADI